MKISQIMLIVLIGLFSVRDVKADICAFVDKDIAITAAGIIKKQSKIIHYCQLCDNAKPVSENVYKVNYKKTDKKYYQVLLNGKNIDLAYVYVKNPEGYDNLAFLSGCDEAKKHKILSFRKDFPLNKETSQDDLNKKSKKEAELILNKCLDKFSAKENSTTYDNLIFSTKTNDCIVEAITKEIKKGFEPKEQAEMFENLKQSRQSVFSFYDKLYNSNKYCIDHCGTMAQLFPYEDETKLLQRMLENLIFLNLAENGY